MPKYYGHVDIYSAPRVGFDIQVLYTVIHAGSGPGVAHYHNAVAKCGEPSGDVDQGGFTPAKRLHV